MTTKDTQRYGPYARQRLFRILLDLQQQEKNLNWSAMAEAIHDWRGILFQRNNFYRLRKGILQDANIEIIVSWIEAVYDSAIRDRLKPDAIFDEVGKAARDYYFHIPASNVMEEWDQQILDEYAGVYLCAPANDKNSYLPLSFLRKWFEDPKAFPKFERNGRSLDIRQYIQERSFLVLQRTQGSYFNAAEYPLSLLFPKSFETLDLRMVYEGVGIISSNSIHVQLRECLSRVPKTHAILISTKNDNQYKNPFGLSLHLSAGTEIARQEWHLISEEDRQNLAAEYRHSIDDARFLSGPAQISVSPLPYLENKITMNFSRDYLYHRKPADFLQNQELHFIKPEIENADEVEKILANPLSIGEFL